MVQHLATLTGTPITVLNMSQQTESADLLGAFKPVDPRREATALHDTWTALFEKTFSLRRNAPFLDAERKAYVGGRWARLAKLWGEAARMAAQRIASTRGVEAGAGPATDDGEAAAGRSAEGVRKKRRTDGEADGSQAAPGGRQELSLIHI